MSKKHIPILIAVFFLLTFSSCTCLYFNTFHNIRKNFNGAEATRSKDGRDVARGSEIKQYNDAIAKASKVLERHPTSSYVDDALFIIGAAYYYLGEYDKSARKFKELFANYPETEYASRARILMAKDKLQLKEEAEAVVIFEEIFEKEKDKKIKANAARALGEYYFEGKDYASATKYFTALIDSLGDATDKLQARLFVADGYFERYTFDKALQNYKKALDYEPDTLQYYRIMYRMAECDYFMNDILGGLEKLGELAQNEQYYDSLAAIRLKMAEGYEWDSDFESAISSYDKVIVENPGTNAAANAYYGLGLIYQYDYEDLDKALEYYQKARDEKRNSPVSEEATRRASKLTTLERYVKSGEADLNADSTGQLEPGRLDQMTANQFKLGELFYFDLEKPDSAVNAYEALVERYPESKYAPRALMSMAFIYRSDFGDSATADSLLRVVLKKYARYDEAREVIDLLGLAGTAADTGYAAIPFAKAEKYFDRFMELDSSQYYMNLLADSMLAADTLEADSAADSMLTADTLLTSDGLKVENVALSAESPPTLDSLAYIDSIRVADSTSRADSLQAAEFKRRSDSLQVADSIRFAEARRVADSIKQAYMKRASDSARTANSTRAADSIKAMELMQTAQALRKGDTTRDSGTEPAGGNLIPGGDSLLKGEIPRISDVISAQISEADGEKSTQQTSLPDTALVSPVESRAENDSGQPAKPETGQALSQASLPGLPMSPTVDSMMAEGTAKKPPKPTATPAAVTLSQASLPDLPMSPTVDSMMAKSTAKKPPKPETTPAAPTPSQASLPDLPMSPTVEAMMTSGTGKKPTPPASTKPPADTTAIAGTAPESDTTEAEIEAPKIDYWQVAFDSARNKYDPKLYALLDSAQQAYNFVIDSFPHSQYSIQARYVLLYMYDKYLAPGDSSMIFLYKSFADSFPGNLYAQAISDEYGIRGAGTPAQRPQTPNQENQQQEQADTSLYAGNDQTGEVGIDTVQTGGQDSKFITDEEGNILEPADKYFLREEVPFEYPLEALAYNIEDKLYFQIRIDFSGEVAEVKLMNETPSSELNERILETVKNTKFDAARIPTSMYDHWFYYTYNVRIPPELRQ